MSITQRTKDLIARGRSDNINSIPTGLQKLDQHIDGITQGTYILVGAETSIGKTTFVRDKFIHTAYEYYLQINDPTKLDVLFVDMSLEITPEFNTVAAVSRKIFMDYQQAISAKRMLRDKSLGDNYKRLIDDMMDNYIADFEKKCLTFEEDITPTKFHDILMSIAKRYGTFSQEGSFISECGTWTANNPNLYIEVILDTINLAELDSGHNSIKSTIDRISRIAVWFRNKCNFIIIIIQQFNAELGGVDRKRFAVTTPKLSDFEDSKRCTKDCDIALGLYEPIRHLSESETTFRGYNMEILRSWYRSLHIMKNRRGENNKVIDMKFDGTVGIFTQLPEASIMSENDYMLSTRH